MYQTIVKFFKSADFYKSITLIIAVLIPLYVSNKFDQITIGFALSFGVFFNAPVNIPGSFKHRTLGLTFSTLLTGLVTLLMGYANKSFVAMLVLLPVLSFSISYVSVFGFRASLVAFTGLLAMVLSPAHAYVELGIGTYALLVTAGGFWYLFLVALMNYLNPSMYVEELLSDTTKLTAEFIGARNKMYDGCKLRSSNQEKLFKLQSEITEKHETLREVILSRRIKSGFSNKIRRKLLIFIELVDILELALVHPINYEKLDEYFNEHAAIKTAIQDLLDEMENKLELVADILISPQKQISLNYMFVKLKHLSVLINERKLKLLEQGDYDDVQWALQDLLEYQTEQVQKIKSIVRVLAKLNLNDTLLKKNSQEAKFITPQDYDFKKLISHFSFRSAIFRHSLRLSLVILVGFLIGTLFEFENTYWIMLTVLVIMRPSYGLTKERMFDRIIGTLVGAVISMAIIKFTQDHDVFKVISIVSLIVALSIVQLNYKTFAVFITTHVIFLYALYEPDIIEVIKFRVLDTTLGAGLAFLSNVVLFPSWEFKTIDEVLNKFVKDSQAYLKAIDLIYRKKEVKDSSYKYLRKQAFLSMGELNAAFQRVTQEPKNVNTHYSELYELVTLGNTFISSTVSLSTFIQKNKTTEASNSYKFFMEAIQHNLNEALAVLNNKRMELSHTESLDARKHFQDKYQVLFERYKHLQNNYSEKELDLWNELKETKLISDQLIYLYKLSIKLKELFVAFKQIRS